MSTLGRPRDEVIVVNCGQIAQLENLPPLTHIQKKSKELAQKWIHDHWSYVQPRLCQFRLRASDGTLISKDTGQSEETFVDSHHDRFSLKNGCLP
jgi:hypothetical protein